MPLEDTCEFRENVFYYYLLHNAHRSFIQSCVHSYLFCLTYVSLSFQCDYSRRFRCEQSAFFQSQFTNFYRSFPLKIFETDTFNFKIAFASDIMRYSNLQTHNIPFCFSTRTFNAIYCKLTIAIDKWEWWMHTYDLFVDSFPPATNSFSTQSRHTLYFALFVSHTIN